MDVKGIDLEGLTKMATAVQSYKRTCSDAVSRLLNLPPNYLNLAIKGETAQAAYNSARNVVYNKALSLINQLSAFESMLNSEIKERYLRGEQTAVSATFAQVK